MADQHRQAAGHAGDHRCEHRRLLCALPARLTRAATCCVIRRCPTPTSSTCASARPSRSREGAVRIEELVGAVQGRAHAGGGGHRQRQPVRRAASSAPPPPRPACSRSSAACWRCAATDDEPARRRASPSPTRSCCWCRTSRLRATCAAGQPGLSSRPSRARRRRSRWSALEAHAEGLIALTGGPAGPVGRLLLRRAAPLAEATAAAPRRGLRRPALCRADAPRRSTTRRGSSRR